MASFFERHREFAADFNAMKDAMLRTITDAQVAFTPDAESGHRDTFERSYQTVREPLVPLPRSYFRPSTPCATCSRPCRRVA